MNRLSQTFKVGLALLFAVLSTNLLPVYASALAAPDPVTPVQKVDICHSAGQSGKYTINNIDTSAIDELNNPDSNNGHGTHENDIIPPFTSSPDNVVYPGKNWNETTQAIYEKDCKTESDIESDSPTAPTFNAITKCGEYGSVVLPIDTDTITYSIAPTNPTQGAFTVTANPAKDIDLDVTGTSYVLGQNGKATFTGNLDTYTVCEQPTTLVECESYQLIEATNLNLNGWTLVRGATFVDGGINLNSPGDWTSSTITRAMSGTLADLGTGVSYTPDTQYLGLHVKTAEGTLVYESAYGGNWWLDDSTALANMKTNAPHQGGGQGSNYYGTLQEWAAAFPKLQVEKLTVLYTSPTPANTTVTSVKIDCKEYTFDYERVALPCSVKSNTYSDVWSYDGYTYPEADDYKVGGTNVVNNGTYSFTNEGLHISTPDKPAYVFGLFDGGNTALADISDMGYTTFRKAISAGYEQTLPAYILYVDTNGATAGGETYFFYEPYYNGAVIEDSWQTWDAINGGNAKWYVSGTGQTLRSWSYLVANYPDAEVLAYGFNQGTSNAETYTVIQDMKFDCATTHFSAPQVLGEETTDPTPVTPTVIVPTLAAVLPAQIAATGANDNQSSVILLTGIVFSAMTYFFVLRRQKSYEL
ncbi:MAG: hypothetical protein ABIQ64_03595 [Candidatus Saccharimonadales bacterium]